MLLVRPDPADPVPLHEQVSAAIRRAIAEGSVVEGERLPPARDLAVALGVNANTVLRSLRELRNEGLLEFRRGRGVTVRAAQGEGVVVEKAKELLRLARQHGYGREELIDMLSRIS